MIDFTIAFVISAVFGGYAAYCTVRWAQHRVAGSSARRGPADHYVVRPNRFALPLISSASEAERKLLADMSLDRTRVAHLDDVAWHEAPIPRRWHRCWSQTTGWYDWFTEVGRCPCGGIWYADYQRWVQRNTRTRKG